MNFSVKKNMQNIRKKWGIIVFRMLSSLLILLTAGCSLVPSIDANTFSNEKDLATANELPGWDKFEHQLPEGFIIVDQRRT